MCKIQKVFSSAFQNKNKKFKIQNILRFVFLSSKKKFLFIQFCAITKYAHNVFYTLHGLMCAIKKKLHQKGSINVKKLQKSDEGKKSKNGKNVISWVGEKIYGLEETI